MKKGWSATQWKALVGGVLLMMCYNMSNNPVAYYITAACEEMGYTRAGFSAIHSVMQGAGIIALFIGGAVIGKIGVRKLLLFATFWVAAGFVALSFGNSLMMMYVAAACIGPVQAICTVVCASTVLNTRFGDQAGFPIGLAFGGTGVMNFLTGMFMPHIVTNLGWRWGYRTVACLWVVAMLVAAYLVGGDIYGYAKKGDIAETGEKVEGFTLKEALKSPWLYVIMLSLGLLNLAGGFFQHMPAHFQAQGYSAVQAGQIMSAYAIVVIFAKIIEGTLFSKLGVKKTTVLIFVTFAVSHFIVTDKRLPVIILGIVVMALGMSSFTVAPPIYTRHMFGSVDYAKIFSIVTLSHNIGTVIGSPLIGSFYDRDGTYNNGLMVMGVLMAVNMFVALFALIGSERSLKKKEQAEMKG